VFSSNFITIIVHVPIHFAGEVAKNDSSVHVPRSSSSVPDTNVTHHGCWLRDFYDLLSIHSPGSLFPFAFLNAL
jgi:hypothetical protein